MTERILRAIRRRFSLMIGRFVLAAIDDAGLDRQGLVSPQRLKGDVFKGERQLEDVAHLQPYGLHSHPHPGAEGIALAVGGSRTNLAVVAVDDPRHSPKNLVEGEVQLYDDQGVKVHFKRLVLGPTPPNLAGEMEVRARLYDGFFEALNVTTETDLDFTCNSGDMNLIVGGPVGNTLLLLGIFGGGININAAGGGGKLEINASLPIEINQDIIVTGNIEYTGTLKQTAANIDLTNHLHGGVTTGGGDTGVPK